jgi:cytochrome c oxidase assembly protein subunit 11
MQPSAADRRNIRTALIPAGMVCAMLGLSYAAVPLYDLFCRVTGFGGTTQVAEEAPSRLGTTTVSVRFDANVNGVPWRFEPEVREVRLRTGEVREVRYRITNVADKPVTAIASYNVTPEATGAFFNKLSCFCFTNQTLQPGESREETVVFFIDPAVEQEQGLKGLQSITLSYTFFPAREEAKPLAALPAAQGEAQSN